MIPLSFTQSRLVKVKAGPSVKQGTYPVEGDLAESWSQPSDTIWIFKLRKGVRWHQKPPVNGRELTAEDVKYTYDRFLTLKGNGNRPLLEVVDKIEALDRHTVKFTLSEPYVWFLDVLATTSTWIVAKECVDAFGDLKKPESVVGTGPWMLERYEPGVRLVYARNPNYFISGLPYTDGVEVTIDRDPASRFAGWLSGRYDFGPEYQHVVRRTDLEVARPRKPGLQTAEYIWFTGGYAAAKLDQEPFKDLRVRGAMGRAMNWQEFLDSSPHALGQGAPNPAVPAAASEWSIPIAELTAEGRELYAQDITDGAMNRRKFAKTAVGALALAALGVSRVLMLPTLSAMSSSPLLSRGPKRDLAQEHLTTATTMYRERDMRFWLEQARTGMDEASG